MHQFASVISRFKSNTGATNLPLLGPTSTTTDSLLPADVDSGRSVRKYFTALTSALIQIENQHLLKANKQFLYS